MKKLAVAMLALVCASSLTFAADTTTSDKKSDDTKAIKKELLDKYDTNKDGKLSKAERAKMTDEDKTKYDKAFPKKTKATDSTTTDKSTNAPATK